MGGGINPLPQDFNMPFPFILRLGVLSQKPRRKNSYMNTSTFATIHSIDMKFGTYAKLHLYFQLSEFTSCLIGLYGNDSQINDVTGGRHLGFLNFEFIHI